jgi:3',5'-cyclic AMP phosphodiesterase CpdA
LTFEELSQTSDTMKKTVLISVLICVLGLNASAQFTFIHLSDLHVSSIPFAESDTNAQYFQCYIREFANQIPKPKFVAVSGDVSNVGNQSPDGMYPVITQYLYPPAQTNPGIGDYFIDPALTIPIYFVPGNHEYWVALVNPPVSNDTLTYYKKFLIPDTDYAVVHDPAVIVFLRSGSDSTITSSNKKGKGLTNEQIAFLRDVLQLHRDKRKIIVMHHPAVNAVGTNSDGTPFTGVINSPEDCSIANNRTTFLNICDSNHVDVVLDGHEHQNVVANRAGQVIPENGSDSTRYVQTAAGFNRSYRIITVNPSYVTVSVPLRSCLGTGVNDLNLTPELSVYPNPATDHINIECTRPALIEILGVDGRVVQRLTADNVPVTADISGLKRGIYLIKASSRSGVAIKKLVKQ